MVFLKPLTRKMLSEVFDKEDEEHKTEPQLNPLPQVSMASAKHSEHDEDMERWNNYMNLSRYHI